jgi:hypothetical protein
VFTAQYELSLYVYIGLVFLLKGLLSALQDRRAHNGFSAEL